MAKIFREVVQLEKAVPGGQALGVLTDGRKVFVWGGLPNEKVEVEVYKVKKSYAEGNVTKVIKASSKRVVARDDCYLSTSPWQVYDFEYENELKNELIRETFRQFNIDFADMPPIKTDGQDYGYRNKMEYSLWWNNDKHTISPAFHRRGSHQKVPVETSSIERQEIFTEAQRIVAGLNANNDEARRYQSLVIRANQKGEVSSALFKNGKPHPKMSNLTDAILGHEFTYSPNGFFQINLPVYEMALIDMREFITSDKVVDMYAGVGSIGLTIAANKDLTLVETNASAVEEMRKNTLLDAKIVQETAEESLEYITGDIDLILDPPRAGLDEKVCERILEALPNRVIYLSCNPATQARDVAKLLTNYKIIYQQAYNFFPHTPHIENLIVLEKTT